MTLNVKPTTSSISRYDINLQHPFHTLAEPLPIVTEEELLLAESQLLVTVCDGGDVRRALSNH